LASESDEEETSASSGRDPEQLRAQAASLRQQEQELSQEIAGIGEALQAAEHARRDAEAAHRDEEERLTRLARAAADRREGLARLSGKVAAARSRQEAGEAEVGRLRSTLEAILTRATTAEQEFATLEGRVLDVEEGEEGLDHDYEAAEQARLAAVAEVERLTEELRAAESEKASLTARAEALELTLRRRDGAAALLAAPEGRGVVGTVTSLVTVTPGHEAAVAAALGWAGDGLVMESLDHARDAIATLRADDQGRAALLVPHTAPDLDRSGHPALPAGAVWAADVVTVADSAAAAVRALLHGVALVADDAQAADLVRQHQLTAVTPDGDVYAAGWVRGGSSAAPSLLEIQGALEQTQESLVQVGARGE